MKTRDILQHLENHKGRKLDLSNRQDMKRLFMAIDREIDKRDAIISNVSNVLNGASTYDKSQYKTIIDSNKKQR